MVKIRRSVVAVSTLAMAVVLAGCREPDPNPTTTELSLGPTASSSPSPVPTESAPNPGESCSGESPEFRLIISGEEGDASGFGWETNADGTFGSGCTPPSGDVLPDGIWLAQVTNWGVDTMTFDLMCEYSWDSDYVREIVAACEEEQGVGSYGCDFDSAVWTSNENPHLRDLPVADDATFIDSFQSTEVPLSEAILDEYLRSTTPMWLFVNGGEITQVLEEYYP